MGKRQAAGWMPALARRPAHSRRASGKIRVLTAELTVTMTLEEGGAVPRDVLHPGLWQSNSQLLPSRSEAEAEAAGAARRLPPARSSSYQGAQAEGRPARCWELATSDLGEISRVCSSLSAGPSGWACRRGM